MCQSFLLQKLGDVCVCVCVCVCVRAHLCVCEEWYIALIHHHHGVIMSLECPEVLLPPSLSVAAEWEDRMCREALQTEDTSWLSL